MQGSHLLSPEDKSWQPQLVFPYPICPKESFGCPSRAERLAASGQSQANVEHSFPAELLKMLWGLSLGNTEASPVSHFPSTPCSWNHTFDQEVVTRDCGALLVAGRTTSL